MHASVTIGCHFIEEDLSHIDAALGTCRAGIHDCACVRLAVVVYVNLLAAMWVRVGVGTICHVNVVHGNEIVCIGASGAARARANRYVVVGHVTRVCTRTARGAAAVGRHR